MRKPEFGFLYYPAAVFVQADSPAWMTAYEDCSHLFGNPAADAIMGVVWRIAHEYPATNVVYICNLGTDHEVSVVYSKAFKLVEIGLNECRPGPVELVCDTPVRIINPEPRLEDFTGELRDTIESLITDQPDHDD